MDNCNIESIDFSSIPEDSKTSLKKLSLAGIYRSYSDNFIMKEGFEYLSRLKMNLTYLDVWKNSLLKDESVESIISFGLSSIEELNVG